MTSEVLLNVHDSFLLSHTSHQLAGPSPAETECSSVVRCCSCTCLQPVCLSVDGAVVQVYLWEPAEVETCRLNQFSSWHTLQRSHTVSESDSFCFMDFVFMCSISSCTFSQEEPADSHESLWQLTDSLHFSLIVFFFTASLLHFSTSSLGVWDFSPALYKLWTLTRNRSFSRRSRLHFLWVFSTRLSDLVLSADCPPDRTSPSAPFVFSPSWTSLI